jgi:hypothetical protein
MVVLTKLKNTFLSSTALATGGLTAKRLNPDPIPTDGLSKGLLDILRKYDHAETTS